ncbi:CAP-associated domain-containing protein [Carnobacterium gallinarum]|uniref:CAP-associated domain-containing protein n=1 Tax=Carnobacterium gallinarum TaxID=2749 RepID=UPI00055331A0|nr:CAP-associated domain-containing protein [Carnobacterium gallinarum]
MKTFLRAIPIFVILMLVFYLEPVLNSKENSKPKKVTTTAISKPKTEMVQATMPVTGLASYLHQPASQVTAKFGEPVRKDLTAYGFEWWIYNQKDSQYLQVGVKDGQVVTLFALGQDMDVAPFKIGMDISKIYQVSTLYPTFEIEFNEDTYSIELSEDDMNYHPLVAFNNGTFAILLLDQVSNKIIGVRYLDADVLLHLNIYEVASMTPIPSVDNQNLDWAKVNQGNETQTLDILNVLRHRNQLGLLESNKTLTDFSAGIFNAYSNRTPEEIQEKELSTKNIETALSKVTNLTNDLDIFYLNRCSDATWTTSYWFSFENKRNLLMNRKLKNIGIRYQKQEVILLLDSLNKI